MPKLKLYEHGDKTYILDGVNIWVYDGEKIEPAKNFIPTIPKESD